MNFYQQGNHVCGSVYVNVGTFNDKTTIKFSTILITAVHPIVMQHQ